MIELPAQWPLLGLSPYYVIYDGHRAHLFGAYVWAPAMADAYETARVLQNRECLLSDLPAPVLDIVPADLTSLARRSAKVTEELLEALKRDVDYYLEKLKS